MTMTIIMSLWIGSVFGFCTCALFAVRQYEKGYRDGKRGRSE